MWDWDKPGVTGEVISPVILDVSLEYDMYDFIP